MAGQVFTYIAHKDGVADDTALELAAAAKKISSNASVTALVAGSGSGLETVCNEMTATYPEIWKFDNANLAYPNAEAIRKLLVGLLPADAIVLLPHNTFGMDRPGPRSMPKVLCGKSRIASAGSKPTSSLRIASALG